MLVAALGFTLAIAPALVLLSVVLLLPGIAAWWRDADPGKPTGRAALGFGVAGAYSSLQLHIRQGQSFELAASLLMNGQVVGAAWGAAVVGWLVGWLAELAFRRHLRCRAVAEAHNLMSRRRELEQEWDLPPGPTG